MNTEYLEQLRAFVVANRVKFTYLPEWSVITRLSSSLGNAEYGFIFSHKDILGRLCPESRPVLARMTGPTREDFQRIQMNVPAELRMRDGDDPA